jgi:hypothetical protein
MAACVMTPAPCSGVVTRTVTVSSGAMDNQGVNSGAPDGLGSPQGCGLENAAWSGSLGIVMPNAKPPPTTAVEIRKSRRVMSILPMATPLSAM